MNLVLPLSLAALVLTSTQAAAAQHPGFPAHWWTPVPRDGAPEWEILPQEAGPGEVILSKRHELGLLSNFAPTPFTFRGKRYASLEGFWQMMLYPEDAKDARSTFPGLKWAHTRNEVAQMSAFEAKAAGTLAEENNAQARAGRNEGPQAPRFRVAGSCRAWSSHRLPPRREAEAAVSLPSWTFAAGRG